MVEKYPKVILRKVDIVDWESAAAKQAGKEFDLQGIPHVRVFGPDGMLVADLSGPSAEDVEAAVQKVHPK